MKLNNALYTKNNYLNKNLRYIKNTSIIEYDMESAGLNILTELGFFSKEYREELLSKDKLERNIIIGKLLKKDPSMVEALEDGFCEARKIFIEKNNITDHEILAIKRDAIYLLDRMTGIDGNISELIKIRPKHYYNTYINILGKEHYFNTSTEEFDVKGYPKEIIEHHNNFLFKELKKCLTLDYINDKDNLFLYLASLKDNMVTFNLDKGYYLDIRHGQYLIRDILEGNFVALPDISDDGKNITYYSNNLSFILDIIYSVL